MRTYSLILVVLSTFTLLAFDLPCANTQHDIPDDWITTRTELFSISHPEGWTPNMDGLMGTKLFLFTQRKSEEDEFSENINLMTEKLPSNKMTLATYAEASEKQIKKFITDAHIISHKQVSINGTTFQNINYTGRQSELLLHFDQYYTIQGGTAYILTLTCTTDSYEEYIEEAQQIIKTFELR